MGILPMLHVRHGQDARVTPMAVFTYRATSTSSAQMSGTIAADTPRQARDLLRQRGLVVREIADYQPAPAKRHPLPMRSRAYRHHATEFIRELATLLGVGVPLLEALQTLA